MDFNGMDFTEKYNLFRCGRLFLGVIIVAVIALWHFAKYENSEITCPSKFEFCTIYGTNGLNMQREQKPFIANSVKSIDVKSYSVHRRHHSSTYYMISAFDGLGQRKVIFDGYYHSSNAKETADKIMDCIKTENYPCKFYKD